MIIYNETIIMDESIYNEWLEWVQMVHIPAVMATGYFEGYRLLNVLGSPNEGVTCCLQYHTSSLEDYNQFDLIYKQHFQDAQQQRFENKFVLFNTLMQTINQ